MTSATAAPETSRQVDNEPGVGLRHTLAVFHGFVHHLPATYSDFDTFKKRTQKPAFRSHRVSD